MSQTKLIYLWKIRQFISPLYLMVNHDLFLVSNWLDSYGSINFGSDHGASRTEVTWLRVLRCDTISTAEINKTVTATWSQQQNITSKGIIGIIEMRGYWLVNYFVLASFCKGGQRTLPKPEYLSESYH